MTHDIINLKTFYNIPSFLRNTYRMKIFKNQDDFRFQFRCAITNIVSFVGKLAFKRKENIQTEVIEGAEA